MASEFVSVNYLRNFGVSCSNRDDMGRHKTALVGGTLRLRQSKQSLMYAAKHNEIYQEALAGNGAFRTRDIGKTIYEYFINNQIASEDAVCYAKLIAEQFGPLKAEKKEFPYQHKSTIYVAEKEYQAVMDFAKSILKDKKLAKRIKDGKLITEDENQLKFLRNTTSSMDIALTGRMFAETSLKDFEEDGVLYMSHATTVHRAIVENDYFSAVDDLNGLGAAHVDSSTFGAGLFHGNFYINKTLLLDKFDGNKDAVNEGIYAITKALLTVSPVGKIRSFASNAWACYALAEHVNHAPPSLSFAFIDAIEGKDWFGQAVVNLENTHKVFSLNSTKSRKYIFNARDSETNLSDLLDFVIS